MGTQIAPHLAFSPMLNKSEEDQEFQPNQPTRVRANSSRNNAFRLHLEDEETDVAAFDNHMVWIDQTGDDKFLKINEQVEEAYHKQEKYGLITLKKLMKKMQGKELNENKEKQKIRDQFIKKKYLDSNQLKALKEEEKELQT